MKIGILDEVEKDLADGLFFYAFANSMESTPFAAALG
jgi:hypothetical protein